MERKKLIGTGLSGLIGTRVVELLSNEYEFEDLSLDTGVDITDKDLVNKAFAKSDASIVLHMAALTDVDVCEADREVGTTGRSWQVNVEGTHNIAEAAGRFNKKLIYVSTDFVFSGEVEVYDEKSEPEPINWYGQTKYEAEKIVQESSDKALIARLAFPYRAHFQKEDIVRFFLNRFKNGEQVRAVDDWIITPTFIDDIAIALDVLIQENGEGVFHVVGSSSHTPFEMAHIIAETFQQDRSLIEPIKLKDLFTGKALRPRRLVLKNDKIQRLGVRMKTFREGLMEVKRQLDLKE